METNKRKINICGSVVTVMDKWSKHLNSPRLARIVADITGDGHLQLKGWRGLVSFYSNEPEEIYRINKDFVTLFGINGHVYEDNRKTRKNTQYKIFFISKDLAKFFQKIGVPPGNKSNAVFEIPEWVQKGSGKIKSGYLRGMYSGEGYIYSTRQKENKLRWRIGIEQYKNEKLKEVGKNFMEQLRAMLSELGIKSSPPRIDGSNIRKDGTKSIGIRFDIEKSSFGNFYKHVGFDSRKKQEKLILALRDA